MRVLCRSSEIANGDARGFALGSERFIVARDDDGLYVYRNRCPHLAIPLEWQPDHFMDADRSFLRCATHGALFVVSTGECVTGPCLGRYLSSIPFVVEGDNVLITVSSE